MPVLLRKAGAGERGAGALRGIRPGQGVAAVEGGAIMKGSAAVGGGRFRLSGRRFPATAGFSGGVRLRLFC